MYFLLHKSLKHWDLSNSAKESPKELGKMPIPVPQSGRSWVSGSLSKLLGICFVSQIAPPPPTPGQFGTAGLKPAGWEAPHKVKDKQVNII